MKYFAFLFLIFASCDIFAQANAEEGEVVFIRPRDFHASLVNFSIFADEQRVSKIANGRFLKYKMKAGKHFISLQRMGKRPKRNAILTPIEVEAGKTKYVLLLWQQGFWKNRFITAEITEASYKNFYFRIKEATIKPKAK
jgi:hypothetical protein